MAKQGRKLKRNAERDSAEKTGKPKSGPISVGGAQAPADPMSSANLKSMALRLGVPVVGVWLIGVLIAGVSQSSTTQSIALGLPAVVTVGLLGVALWGLRQAKKAKGVAGILAGAKSDGDREKAGPHEEGVVGAGRKTRGVLPPAVLVATEGGGGAVDDEVDGVGARRPDADRDSHASDATQ